MHELIFFFNCKKWISTFKSFLASLFISESLLLHLHYIILHITTTYSTIFLQQDLSFTPSRIIPHRRYNADTFNDDFALLRLETPIDFASDFDRIAPACLPTQKVEDGETVKWFFSKKYSKIQIIEFIFHQGKVTGWGTLYEGSNSLSPTLQEEKLKNFTSFGQKIILR